MRLSSNLYVVKILPCRLPQGVDLIPVDTLLLCPSWWISVASVFANLSFPRILPENNSVHDANDPVSMLNLLGTEHHENIDIINTWSLFCQRCQHKVQRSTQQQSFRSEFYIEL